jgi:hypothetical protein
MAGRDRGGKDANSCSILREKVAIGERLSL